MGRYGVVDEKDVGGGVGRRVGEGAVWEGEVYEREAYGGGREGIPWLGSFQRAVSKRSK